MTEERYHGYSAEYTADGRKSTFVYHGTRDEMETLAARHQVDEYNDDGRLEEIRIGQAEGSVWECELRYDVSMDWQSVARPPTQWGVKSAQLHGSMRSMPLESHPNYRANWNHYLAAAPGISVVPQWWNSATDTLLDIETQKSYCWCRSYSERPGTPEGLWNILRRPRKPGVSSYDVASYSITETARFRSHTTAGKMAANALNRIGTPCTVFGISGGNWKCDDAEVSWNGRFWLARLNWSHSCSESGWDSDLYS